MKSNKVTEYIIAALVFVLSTAFVIALGVAADGDPATTTYYQFNGATSLPITSSAAVALTRLGTISTYSLTPATGAAIYTGTLSLSDAGSLPGDIIRIAIAWPGSGYPRLVVTDGSAAGTVLVSDTDTGIAGFSDLWFVNTSGTQWTYTPKGDQPLRKEAPGVEAALSGSNAAMGLSGTTTAICAPKGTTVIFDGDSITQSPNGAGVTSWAGMLATGTYPANSWFATSRNIVAAQGGSILDNGTLAAVAGLPQTIVAKWSGSNASTLTIVSGSASSLGSNNGAPIPMGVFGSQIQFGTTGTITSSGTALALSAPTTGTSGTGITLRLGGNNSMDRFPSQVAPHATAQHGGDSGNGPVYYIIQGFANNLRGGESAAQIESGLIALSATAQSYGMTPVIGTCLPTAYLNYLPMWWSSGQENVREQVNGWLLQGNVSGAYVVDSVRGMSGQPVNTGTNTNWPGVDGNGIHPIGVSNSDIAIIWNNSAISGWGGYKAQPQYVDTATEFQQSVTLDQGITVSGSTSTSLPLIQAALAVGQSQSIVLGPGGGIAYNQANIGFGYIGQNSEENWLALGIQGADPLILNAGGNSNTGEVAIGYPASSVTTLMNGNQKVAIQLNPNTEDGIDITTTGAYPYFWFNFASQPNIGAGSSIKGYWVGTGKSTGNSMGVNWLNEGNNASSSGLQVFDYASVSHQIWFNSGDVTIGAGTTDNGYGLEVTGSTRLDAPLVVGTGGSAVSSLLTFTGTAALPQMNPSTSGTMTIANSGFVTGGKIFWLASTPLPSNAVLASGTVTNTGTAQLIFNNPSTSSTVGAITVPYQLLYLH